MIERLESPESWAWNCPLWIWYYISSTPPLPLARHSHFQFHPSALSCLQMRVTLAIAVLNCLPYIWGAHLTRWQTQYASINHYRVVEGQDMRIKPLGFVLALRRNLSLEDSKSPIFSKWHRLDRFNLALSITGSWRPGRWVIRLRASWRTAFQHFIHNRQPTPMWPACWTLFRGGGSIQQSTAEPRTSA